jgi:ubiquinone biosynthesis protein COQ4
MMFSRLRALKALYSLANLVRDPSRLGEVFEISDALTTPKALNPVIDRLCKNATVAETFEHRHRIRVSIPELRELPRGTLGREFAEHMISNNLDPSALPTLPSRNPYEFFRAHLYETHDVWHAVTGFDTDVVGELGLQGFYLAQIPAPLPLLLLAIGFVRSAIYDEALTEPFMEALIHGYRMGKDAVPFFGVRWDELWGLPLEEVRSRVGISASAARGVRKDVSLAA